MRGEKQALAEEVQRLAERLAAAEAERSELQRRLGELSTEVDNRRASSEVRAGGSHCMHAETAGMRATIR